MNKLVVVCKYKKPSPFNLYKKKKYTFKFDDDADEIIRNVGIADVKFKLDELGMLEYSISLCGMQERNDVLDYKDTEYYIPNVTDLCCIYSLTFVPARRR